VASKWCTCWYTSQHTHHPCQNFTLNIKFLTADQVQSRKGSAKHGAQIPLQVSGRALCHDRFQFIVDFVEQLLIHRTSLMSRV
jgi:hypothetical protein